MTFVYIYLIIGLLFSGIGSVYPTKYDKACKEIGTPLASLALTLAIIGVTVAWLPLVAYSFYTKKDQ